MKVMNTVLVLSYRKSERYEALNSYQGLYFMHSYKIMRYDKRCD